MDTPRILVVDDEPDFLEVITLRFQAKGYEVATARSGAEALAQIESERPAAVLLDIVMPEIDGLAVLRTIRQRDQRLPVFIITARPDDQRFAQAKQFQASGFLVKTGDLGQEIDNITKVLDVSRRYRADER